MYRSGVILMFAPWSLWTLSTFMSWGDTVFSINVGRVLLLYWVLLLWQREGCLPERRGHFVPRQGVNHTGLDLVQCCWCMHGRSSSDVYCRCCQVVKVGLMWMWSFFYVKGSSISLLLFLKQKSLSDQMWLLSISPSIVSFVFSLVCCVESLRFDEGSGSGFCDGTVSIFLFRPCISCNARHALEDFTTCCIWGGCCHCSKLTGSASSV